MVGMYYELRLFTCMLESIARGDIVGDEEKVISSPGTKYSRPPGTLGELYIMEWG